MKSNRGFLRFAGEVRLRVPSTSWIHGSYLNGLSIHLARLSKQTCFLLSKYNRRSGSYLFIIHCYTAKRSFSLSVTSGQQASSFDGNSLARFRGITVDLAESHPPIFIIHLVSFRKTHKDNDWLLNNLQSLLSLISISTDLIYQSVHHNVTRVDTKPSFCWKGTSPIEFYHLAGSCIQWGGRLNQGEKEWSSPNPGESTDWLFFSKRPCLGKPRCGGSMCRRSPPHRWGLWSTAIELNKHSKTKCKLSFAQPY